MNKDIFNCPNCEICKKHSPLNKNSQKRISPEVHFIATDEYSLEDSYDLNEGEYY